MPSGPMPDFPAQGACETQRNTPRTVILDLLQHHILWRRLTPKARHGRGIIQHSSCGTKREVRVSV